MISPQALMAARQLQGVDPQQLLPAIGGILEKNPKMPLMQLIAAHHELTQQQQKQQAMQAMQMAQQGGGVTPQQPTTVAQDTQQGLAQLAMQDRQPMMQQQAAPQEPTMQAAQGGLMGLPVHNFNPENYAHGGIVAFGDPELNPNEDQVVEADISRQLLEQDRQSGLGAYAPRAAAPAAARPAAGGYQDLIPENIRQMGATAQANLASVKPFVAETPEAISERQATAREAALTKAGMDKEPFKARINDLTAQAQQAREGRDTDRLLALAQGFFAMGAAKSPYALQNFSAGLGITAKELRGVESEYRKGEKTRKESIVAAKEAQRAEVLGYNDKAETEYARQQTLEERSKEHFQTANAAILGRVTGVEGNIITNQTRADALRGQREQLGAYRQSELDRRIDADKDRQIKAYADKLGEQQNQLNKQRDSFQKNSIIALQIESATSPETRAKLLASDAGKEYAKRMQAFDAAEQKLSEQKLNFYDMYAGRVAPELRRTPGAAGAANTSAQGAVDPNNPLLKQ
jgi:hypothetical protein